MSRRTWMCGLAWLLALALVTGFASGQEKKPSEEPKKLAAPQKVEPPQTPEAGKPGEKPEAGMLGGDIEEFKRMMEYGTPGEGHARLEPLVGTWRDESRWWMSPDAEPVVSKGTSEYKWTMDKRYIQQDMYGEAENKGPYGEPFHGLGLIGYDNMKKEYTCVWLDNTTTGMTIGHGTMDASGKVLTVTGESPDPATRQLNKKWRGVIRIESHDKHIYEMYSTGPDGKEAKDMEIIYTRVK